MIFFRLPSRPDMVVFVGLVDERLKHYVSVIAERKKFKFKIIHIN